MAITNKEIIANQLRRINEKAQTNFQLENVCGALYLTEDKTFGKISSNFTRRTSSQMIEYLAGLEDAINARPQRVYFIRCEVNDHGWSTGFYHFVHLEDAIKLMRKYVAYQIWLARIENKKVFLKVFRDSVMGDVSKIQQRSQTIFVRIDNDTFEYRACSEDLNYSELPKDRFFNF